MSDGETQSAIALGLQNLHGPSTQIWAMRLSVDWHHLQLQRLEQQLDLVLIV